jgi:hypothetical protein
MRQTSEQEIHIGGVLARQITSLSSRVLAVNAPRKTTGADTC